MFPPFLNNRKLYFSVISDKDGEYLLHHYLDGKIREI